jgi:hypothetical protein
MIDHLTINLEIKSSNPTKGKLDKKKLIENLFKIVTINSLQSFIELAPYIMVLLLKQFEKHGSL